VLHSEAEPRPLVSPLQKPRRSVRCPVSSPREAPAGERGVRGRKRLEPRGLLGKRLRREGKRRAEMKSVRRSEGAHGGREAATQTRRLARRAERMSITLRSISGPT